MNETTTICTQIYPNCNLHRMVHISPKIPANVLRKFLIVSSTSSLISPIVVCESRLFNGGGCFVICSFSSLLMAFGLNELANGLVGFSLIVFVVDVVVATEEGTVFEECVDDDDGGGGGGLNGGFAATDDDVGGGGLGGNGRLPEDGGKEESFELLRFIIGGGTAADVG